MKNVNTVELIVLRFGIIGDMAFHLFLAYLFMLQSFPFPLAYVC